METICKRLAAVRAATVAIRPALMCFYQALDQGQRVGLRFVHHVAQPDYGPCG